MGYIRSF